VQLGVAVLAERCVGKKGRGWGGGVEVPGEWGGSGGFVVWGRNSGKGVW